jgi:pyruvate/2-oxoglutarate dehydrogenase complex dihydrolipoamide dehydrogenase (E3) component
MADSTRLGIEPLDEHNLRLLSNVHPSDWKNPEPKSVYNLVVVGAGTAGLITAIGAAGLGAKVALVERNLMGGDCLNMGCVPSKSLISSARMAHRMRNAGIFGLPDTSIGADAFPAVMDRLRRIRSDISIHDSVSRYTDAGVDVFLGSARFEGPDHISVDGKKLQFRKAVIATGARAVHPSIEGLDEAGFLTNETIFNLTSLPRRLLVIGGGPLGCELAQAFRRLGSEVFIVQSSRFLPKEDPDASALLARVMKREGIQLRTNAKPVRVVKQPGHKSVLIRSADGEEIIDADEILIGAGRQPNVEGLNLEKAGVAYDSKAGVIVDDFLRTSNPHIYAAGDICMAYKFTHTAEASARIVIQNSLFLGRKKLSALTIPWCTYTDPEIAHVGLYEHEARDRGIDTSIFQVHMNMLDRAVTDSADEGFVKIMVKKGSDRILGATIVSSHAGDMISEVSVAMSAGIGLGKLSGIIHPYPTQAEAIKRAADAYNKTRLTPRLKKLLSWWLNRLR